MTRNVSFTRFWWQGSFTNYIITRWYCGD